MGSLMHSSPLLFEQKHILHQSTIRLPGEVAIVFVFLNRHLSCTLFLLVGTVVEEHRAPYVLHPRSGIKDIITVIDIHSWTVVYHGWGKPNLIQF
jgi:hypothetical protein